MEMIFFFYDTQDYFEGENENFYPSVRYNQTNGERSVWNNQTNSLAATPNLHNVGAITQFTAPLSYYNQQPLYNYAATPRISDINYNQQITNYSNSNLLLSQSNQITYDPSLIRVNANDSLAVSRQRNIPAESFLRKTPSLNSQVNISDVQPQIVIENEAVEYFIFNSPDTALNSSGSRYKTSLGKIES